MSRELTLIEKMGMELEERDGLFYPLMNSNECVSLETKSLKKIYFFLCVVLKK